MNERLMKKNLNLLIVLAFIFSLGTLVYSLAKLNFLPAIFLLFFIALLQGLIAPLFSFGNILTTKTSLFPFLGSGDMYIFNIWGHIFLFFIFFIICSLIIFYRERKSDGKKNKSVEIFKITALLTLIIFIVSLIVLPNVISNNLDERRANLLLQNEAVSSQDATICAQIKDPLDRDICYYRVTIYNGDAENCKKIESEDYKNRCNTNIR